MKMSLTEFDKKAHTEWMGHEWYYDTAYQSGSEQLVHTVVHIKFTDVAVMVHPNRVTFKNAFGDRLALDGICGVEMRAMSESAKKIVFFIGRKEKKEISVVMI